MTLSFQLYSARTEASMAAFLPRLAHLGYTAVEGYAGVYDDPAAFRAALDANGLAMPSGHFFPVDAFEADLDTTLATAKTLGMERLFCPAPTDAYREGADAAAWADLARRLHEAGKKVTDAGFRFGWHNHHWEFMALPTGETPMTLLLEGAPDMEWEMDVAWAVRGGADPLNWIAEHAARITTAHVKDIAPEGTCADEDGWADVGEGVMDWPGLIRALQGAGVDLFIAEHDKPSDVTRFATRSAAAMEALV